MNTTPRQVFDFLKASSDLLRIDVNQWSERDRKRLEVACEKLVADIRVFQSQLDPVAMPDHLLDPANPAVFAELIASNLMFQQRQSLAAASEARFYGSGVYAIFYDGNFDAYRPISGTEIPIYTGKSQPEPGSITPKQQGIKLCGRLREHAKSIAKADNLDLRDFSCRFLVLATGWEKAAEHYLISHYHPIWNKESKVCQGFGKHGDAAETRKNSRSAWDTFHMGRNWAVTDDNKPNEKSVDEIKQGIANHFAKYLTSHDKAS